MTCGIYALSFCGRNRIYIGQSKNVIRRFEEHADDLKAQRHHNSKVQRIYNKFQNTMRTNILFECPASELDKWEQLFIDVLWEDQRTCLNVMRSINEKPAFVKKEMTLDQMKANALNIIKKKANSISTVGPK